MSREPQHGRSPLIEFLGGAGSVTGSRYLISFEGHRILVDCGLYQGQKELRLRNWQPFPVPPSTIDAVLLTHAHVDHSGYLPALQRNGFRGRILATEGTSRLCEIVLRDSGRLQEEEAAYANRKGYSKHDPARPLFTEEDALLALELFEVVPYLDPVKLVGGASARFHPAGHILGSATVEIQLPGGGCVVVSGDLGRDQHPILNPPSVPKRADVVLVESTYGDRVHADDGVLDDFAHAIARTAGRGGVAVIPAFAVDRTEVVLLALGRLEAAGRIPRVPVFVDSPMALSALRVYRDAIREGWPEIRPELRGDHDPFGVSDLRETPTVDQSRAINEVDGPAIIVSASGMASGGRVLHHLKARLPDPRNCVILVGFQALGTRGRRLLAGESAIKMLGDYVPVRSEVVDSSAFSVHADRDELLGWMRRFESGPAMTFVIHGEPSASESLCRGISGEIGWPSVVPRLGERVRLPGPGSG